MATYRILITGSREWTDRERMRNALSHAARGNTLGWPIVVIHGGARGADSMAGALTKESRDSTEEVHLPDWRPMGIYNPYAGFARNQKMVDMRADVCLAFLQAGSANRGTSDCAKRARLAGIPVMKIWSDYEQED